MRISPMSKKDTQENHIGNKPMLLINHLKKLYKQGQDTSPTLEITVFDIYDKEVVYIKNYWLRLSEYIKWKEVFSSGISLHTIKNCELSYTSGLFNPHGDDPTHYYKGTITLKR